MSIDIVGLKIFHAGQHSRESCRSHHALQTRLQLLLIHRIIGLSKMNMPCRLSRHPCPNNTSNSSWPLHSLFFRKPPCCSAMRPLSSTTFESFCSGILHTTLLRRVKTCPGKCSHCIYLLLFPWKLVLQYFLHAEGTLPCS